MVLKLSTILCLIFYGCSFGSDGVFYREMLSKPSIYLSGDTLKVKLSQTVHSAQVIFSIDVTVDHPVKKVFISAERGIMRDIRDEFSINLKDYGVNDPSEYSFYWIDPPIQVTTKLDIDKIVN